MIDSSPRPLPRHRLERLIRGLKTRFSTSARKLSEEAADVGRQLSELEADYSRKRTEQQAGQEEALAASTTAWDEALHGRWDDAEMRSFKAVFETAEMEVNLRRQAKKSIETATAEAKKRIAEIERRFMHSKDVPIKRLNDFRATSLALLEELQQADGAADAALLQRSLRAPQVELGSLQLPACSTSSAALEQLQASVSAARQHIERLANHPAARFLGSATWWLICAVFFGLVLSGLYFSGLQTMAGAALAATGATVVLILISLVGIHPWLKRSAMAEYPKLKTQVAIGQQLAERGLQLAIEENDAELKRLASKRDQRFEQAKQWRDKQVTEITSKLDADYEALREKAAHEKQLASDYLSSSLQTTNAEFENRLLEERQRALQLLHALDVQRNAYREQLESQVASIQHGGHLRLQIASEKALKIIARSRRWCDAHFPDWDSMQNSENAWPEVLSAPVLPLGSVAMPEGMLASPPVDAEPESLQAPLLFAPISDGYLTITGDPNSPAIAMFVRNLIMRSLTTLAAGKTQVCVIDPPGLGRDFGWLMHLGDFDPTLVTHRVWTQTNHIAKQLENLAHAAEDFIQQSLRNQYQHIEQYNQDAGALAEPYRLLVWSSMPAGLDDQAWRSLQSLLDSGVRCGIIPILILDPTLNWPVAGQREAIMRRGVHLALNEDGCTFTATSPARGTLTVEAWPAPTQSQAQHLVNEVGRRACFPAV